MGRRGSEAQAKAAYHEQVCTNFTKASDLEGAQGLVFGNMCSGGVRAVSRGVSGFCLGVVWGCLGVVWAQTLWDLSSGSQQV